MCKGPHGPACQRRMVEPCALGARRRVRCPDAGPAHSRNNLEDVMVMSLSELLAADPSALRHADWVEFQRLARESIRDNDRIHFPCREVELRIVEAGKADARDAARMREVDALVGAGMVDRLASWVVDDNARHDPKYASWAEKSEGHRDRVRSVVGRVLTAFAAALLTDGAVEAFDNGYDNAFAPELDRFRAGIRAAIRAAGMEPVAGVAMSPDAKKTLDELTVILSRHVGETGASEGAVDVLERKLSELKTERARADKAEAAVREWQARAGTAVVSAESLHDELRVVMRERNEAQQVAAGVPVLTERANKAEADLAALETVIAETAHAAGISGTMTPAARVRAMGRAIVEERNMSRDCQTERNATLAKNRELNERATKAEGALVQMTKRAEAAETAYASREAYDASIQATLAAESECKALRAEVAALRGLADKPAAVSAVTDAYDYPGPRTLRDRARNALAAAIATVPPAKVGDAVKPEAPGLEPLPLMSTYGVPELRAITARVNVLSAIVKRGGL